VYRAQASRLLLKGISKGLKSQYSAVGAAATASLNAATFEIRKTIERHDLEKNFELPPDSGTREFDISKLLAKMERRKSSVERYINAYRQYCWPVDSLDDL
jgi:protein phosphatase